MRPCECGCGLTAKVRFVHGHNGRKHNAPLGFGVSDDGRLVATSGPRRGTHHSRLVMEGIVGRRLKPTEIVHHIDGNRRNDSPDNLRLFPSAAEHMAWHRAHSSDWTVLRGERHSMAKLTEPEVRRIRIMRGEGVTLREIGVVFGVDLSTVAYICNRKLWSHVS